MNYQLGVLDTVILVLYGLVMVVMGVYFMRKTKTSEEFMVAGMGIPAWAAGIAVMSAYTSSISYIATPGPAAPWSVGPDSARAWAAGSCGCGGAGSGP